MPHRSVFGWFDRSPAAGELDTASQNRVVTQLRPRLDLHASHPISQHPSQ